MSKVKTVEQIRKNVLFSVFLTIFLDLVGFGLFIPILPLVARQFGASDAGASSVASVYSIGTFLAVALLGRLSDKWGRKKLLIGTVALSTVAQILTGLASNFPLLLAFRFVAGLASGNISVAQACISDVTKPEERGKSMALIGIAFGLGFSLGPAIGALVSVLAPNQAIWGISIAACLLNLINLLFVVRRLPETLPKMADAVLVPLQEAIRLASPAEPETATGTWWGDFIVLTQDKAFRIVLLVGFLQVFGFIGVESILSMMLVDSFHITEQRMQYFAFMFIGLMLVLVNGGITRPLIKRLGEVRTLNLGQLLLCITMIGLPLVAPNLILLYCFLFLLAAGSGLSNPSISSLTSRLAPSHMQGFALGTAQTLGALARIVGPASFGFFYQTLAGDRSLFVSAGIMVLGWVVAVFGLQSTQQKFLDGKSLRTVDAAH